MDVDERLRLLAEEVPAPPRGDASEVFAKGIRRRRRRQVGGVAAAMVMVAAVGIGAASLMDRPARLDIADQPPPSTSGTDEGGTSGLGDGPTIVQPPALIVASSEPFPWTVALSATEGDRWCATAVQGDVEVDGFVGQSCEQPLTLPDDGDLLWHGSEPDRRDGPTDQGLSWGLAPADVHTVLVGFTDGSHGEALLATDAGVDAVLWAIAYEGVDIQLIEASGDRQTIGTAVLDGFDALGLLRAGVALIGLVVLLIVVAWFVRRRIR